MKVLLSRKYSALFLRACVISLVELILCNWKTHVEVTCTRTNRNLLSLNNKFIQLMLTLRSDIFVLFLDIF